MNPIVTLVHLRWQPVEGATGYEIKVNGTRVATTGPRARTTKLSVGASTKVEIVDLPHRKNPRTLEFAQREELV